MSSKGRAMETRQTPKGFSHEGCCPWLDRENPAARPAKMGTRLYGANPLEGLGEPREDRSVVL